MKLLQLNIWQGKFLDRIISYVKEYDIDILQFQEVAGGTLSRGGHNDYDKPIIDPVKNTPIETYRGVDIFQELQEQLPSYSGINAPIYSVKGDPQSYFANATFVKSTFPILDHTVLWTKDFEEIPDDSFNKWEETSRNAIFTTINVKNKPLTLINTHMAWGPTPYDEPYKIEQSDKLLNAIKKLTTPFILTGDFNVIAETEIVKKLSTLGNNLSIQNNVSNTLNPNTHPVQHLFPKGLAVDYIITHPEISVKSFSVVSNPDLSDHFGLFLECNL